MKLNIGCGDKKRVGYVNVDYCGSPDVVKDLSVFPWPWADDSIDEVYSEHFLEHAQDYERTILEIHRILKPGGVIWFIVPHFRAPMAIWHLHKWQFSAYTPELLCVQLPYQWGGKKLFDKIAIRVYIKYCNRIFGLILTKLANLSPYRWDYLGLPIDEIEFRGRKC
jgi:ubiquinone/menaquinone biosynthesis C-methylase UbiE